MNNVTICGSFETLMNYMFIKYRGCLIEKNRDGFKVFGKNYPTEYIAKKVIDLAIIKFNKPIK